MLIAVDFDGTVVEHDFPRIGKPMPYARLVLGELVEAGHQIILWTCREDHPTDINRRYLQDAVDWFDERDIPLYGINATPVEADFREFVEGKVTVRKAYADLYIDDRNLGGFPGWWTVRQRTLGDEERSWEDGVQSLIDMTFRDENEIIDPDMRRIGPAPRRRKRSTNEEEA